MNPLGDLFDARLPAGLGGRWYGVFPALVTDIKDPDGQGRVKISLPWSPDAQEETCDLWARVATLMAGNDRGSWFIPEVNDEVLVAFEGGDPRRPYVLGGLWNGQDKPPESMDSAGENNKKVIRSRNGVKITLDDKNGQETLILETPAGQKVTLADSPASLELVDSNGNSVKLEAAGITINCNARFVLSASSVEISAGMVKVDSGMSKFSGIVQADTVISSTVISSTYTPGAGNIW